MFGGTASTGERQSRSFGASLYSCTYLSPSARQSVFLYLPVTISETVCILVFTCHHQRDSLYSCTYLSPSARQSVFLYLPVTISETVCIPVLTCHHQQDKSPASTCSPNAHPQAVTKHLSFIGVPPIHLQAVPRTPVFRLFLKHAPSDCPPNTYPSPVFQKTHLHAPPPQLFSTSSTYIFKLFQKHLSYTLTSNIHLNMSLKHLFFTRSPNTRHQAVPKTPDFHVFPKRTSSSCTSNTSL